MKKITAILCIICLGLVLFISGCTQQNNGGTTTGNTVTMTATELNEDMIMDSDWATYITIGYGSLQDGDTLILQDNITNITYDSTTDATTVNFEWINGTETASVNIVFTGDITSTYLVGDLVKITQEIKHVTFTYQTIAYDMELFKDQWVDQDYFITNAASVLGGLKPLPQSSIVKV